MPRMGCANPPAIPSLNGRIAWPPARRLRGVTGPTPAASLPAAPAAMRWLTSLAISGMWLPLLSYATVAALSIADSILTSSAGKSASRAAKGLPELSWDSRRAPFPRADASIAPAPGLLRRGVHR